MTARPEPSTARSVSAIVLAGGRSARFGRDKLVEPVDGVRLLDRAILAVGLVAREIVIVCPPFGDSPSLPVGVGRPIRIARDREAHAGPLHGVLAGLERAAEPIAIVVGGDMPSLVPAVLAALVDELAATGAEAVVLGGIDGRPLPMVVRVGAALGAARSALETGERRLRALPLGLASVELAEVAWRAIDPAGRTLADVDEPADLDRESETPV